MSAVEGISRPFRRDAARSLKLTDAVEKVENRKPPKISRKSCFRHCCSGKVLWSQYEGLWSFLYIDVGPPVAAREAHQRSLKFSYSTRKNFFDSIDPKATFRTTVLDKDDQDDRGGSGNKSEVVSCPAPPTLSCGAACGHQS
jgi:hypothetical protein